MMIVQYLRSILFSFIALPIWTLCICIFGSPMLLMPRKKFMHLIHFWAKGVDFLEAVILNLRYEVRGLEHFPKGENCIIAAKHMSTYETFKIHSLFQDGAVILKKELFKVPFWGQFLKKSGVIAIDRSTPKQAIKSVNDGAVQAAQDGRTIIIYPQGTRVNPDTTTDEVPYKTGIYRIADLTQLPVIPLATNSGCFWPKGQLLKRSGTVVFEFLPEVKMSDDRKAFMQTLENTLEERSKALFR